MRSALAKKERAVEIEVAEIELHEATFYLIGTTPFYCNRVAVKGWQELLFPRGRLTAAQKAAQLKHDPPKEFRDSAYTRRTDIGNTRILMKATSVKGAVGQAAIDMPTEVARAQIDRLVYLVDEMIDIYGLPRLNMDVVRNSDMKHTADVRTRAKIFPWATMITMRFASPMLNVNSIATLLRASGKICGIGDFRQQKGKGNNGLYSVHYDPTPEWQAIADAGGREAQDAAFANIECSDPDSEDLLMWYFEELKRRRAQPAKTPKGKGEPIAMTVPAELIAGIERANGASPD